MSARVTSYPTATVKRAARRAVAMMGSEYRLAKACGVSQTSISKVKLTGKISPHLALAIHRATKGLVAASELRPDLWCRPEHVPVPIEGHDCGQAAVGEIR
jgi:DNA-binding transcriptional regulator YdaS (Cro superfamily)